MRDLGQQGQTGSGVLALPSAAEISDLTGRIAAGSGKAMTDAERIDFLRAAEVLKCALEGAQAQVSLEFEASQRAEQARAGVRAERQGRGIAAQIALARRVSHHRASGCSTSPTGSAGCPRRSPCSGPVGSPSSRRR